MDHLRARGWCDQRCTADGRRRMARLALYHVQRFCGAERQALYFVAPADHDGAQQFHSARVGCVQKQHRRERAGIEFALALTAQEIAHRDRHVAEIDVHRARIHAFMADRAVIGDVAEFVEMPQRHAAPRLFLVEKRFDQQTGRENLVARVVEQVGARHVRRTHRLAFAAAQAVLDRGGDFSRCGLFQDQALGTDQTEARCVGVLQRRAGQQLALVEAALWIDLFLVGTEALDFFGIEKIELGDANAVLARNDAIERLRQTHDTRDRLCGGLQHLVVVGVDRYVGVHVAVAGVHVQRDEYPPAQHFVMDRVAALENFSERPATENIGECGTDFVLP